VNQHRKINTRRMVDPPSGWLYGFPCELPEDKDMHDLLREHGYPEDQIDFACSYLRMWEEPIQEEDER